MRLTPNNLVNFQLREELLSTNEGTNLTGDGRVLAAVINTKILTFSSLEKQLAAEILPLEINDITRRFILLELAEKLWALLKNYGAEGPQPLPAPPVISENSPSDPLAPT
ncbi:MAG: hypothetical protein ACRCTY_06155, partial [Candidatus Adiutrix sp.]